MIQLSGLDGLFINMEMRGLPMHISSFSLYDPATAGGPVGFDQIVETYAAAVRENVPALRTRLHPAPMGMDQPYWVEDPDFNIDLHVRRMALPEPGTWQTLTETLAQLHAEPLHREKPLWEAWVIENLDAVESFPAGCFGIFLKAHHALMDGRTGLKIFTSLHALDAREAPMALASETPVCADADNEKGVEAYEKPSLSQALLRGTINSFSRTAGFWNLAGRELPATYRRVRAGLDNAELQLIEAKEKTCFNDVISQRRVIDRVRIPIPTMQAIRGAVPGCTLNEVALTIISGAMRRYLQALDTLPEASLVATVPIDVRARDDANKAGNMLSIMNVALASDIEDDFQRLEQVHIESGYSKRYSRTLGKALLGNLMNCLSPGMLNRTMPAFINSPLFKQLPCVANTLITNVPGAPVPLYFSGARLVESFGLGPLIPNTSLFHTITSTCDWIGISYTSCPEAMEDPALYTQCLQEAYEDLAACTGATKVVVPIGEVTPEPAHHPDQPAPAQGRSNSAAA